MVPNILGLTSIFQGRKSGLSGTGTGAQVAELGISVEGEVATSPGS